MDQESQKEVYFHQYCETCKHKNLEEKDEPCFECLEYPTNTDSHKPVKYESK